MPFYFSVIVLELDYSCLGTPLETSLYMFIAFLGYPKYTTTTTRTCSRRTFRKKSTRSTFQCARPQACHHSTRQKSCHLTLVLELYIKGSNHRQTATLVAYNLSRTTDVQKEESKGK